MSACTVQEEVVIRYGTSEAGQTWVPTIVSAGDIKFMKIYATDTGMIHYLRIPRHGLGPLIDWMRKLRQNKVDQAIIAFF